MTKYYELLSTLKSSAEETNLVNMITQGDITAIDIQKNMRYPLVHIIVNNATFQNQTIRFNVDIICADILDVNKESVTDIFRGNDNEIDILNNTLTILNRMFEVFRRNPNDFEVDTDATLNPFVMRFENGLAGWQLTFDVVTYSNMSIC